MYVTVTPELAEALDRRWTGREPRHDMRFAVVREWYVPAPEWQLHYGRHPISYHGYHGLDICHWRYPRGGQEYLTLWCESHGDIEHAKETIKDIRALLDEASGPNSYRVLKEEFRNQEIR
ncbi:MAG: hypothetical protein HW403_311 [Dehalococcoidia bacterium]|nr:hypothetical protein [Dehalococcoidia bacterium]